MPLEYTVYNQLPELPLKQNEEPSSIDQSIDLLIHQKSKLLNTKLEIFAEEIAERLKIRKTNHSNARK